MFNKALHTLALQALGTVSVVALGIVLARVLGPTGRGIISYATLVLGFAAIYAEGPATAIITQYARDKIARSDVYRASLRALAVLVVPAAVAFVLAAVAVPGQMPLLAVACALPFAVYAQCIKGFFLAEGRVQTANVVDFLAIIGYAVIGSAVVVLGGGVVGALVTWVVAYGAAAGYATVALGRRPPLAAGAHQRDPGSLARDQLVFGSKSGFVYVAGYLNLRMGAFVVAAMLGSAALGIYAIVISVCELLWKISSALVWASLGRIAGDEDAELRAFVGRLTRTIILVELVLGGLLFISGPWLIERVYGPAFASVSLPLRIMILGAAAYAIEPIFGYFLLVRSKRPLLVFAIQAASAALCAGIAAVLIPAHGLAGAAVATAITYTGVVVVKLLIVARIMHLRILDLVVPRPDDVRAVVNQVVRLVRRVPRSTGAAA